ncbi:hypothetical protein NCS56_00800300 [Fusarium sp. Ph1]|nr:hypothetical protein NCS56_00800300 [Fusarium sp. Ph1]
MTLVAASNPSTAVRLDTQRDWSLWIMSLEVEARAYHLWEQIDPAKPDAAGDLNPVPKLEPYEVYSNRRLKEHHERELTNASRRAAGGLAAAQAPAARATPTSDEIARDYQLEIASYSELRKGHKEISTKHSTLMSFITKSVNPAILSSVTKELVTSNPDGYSVRQLIRALQAQLAPSSLTTHQEAIKRYEQVLKEAGKARQDPHAWIRDWNQAYAIARAHDIPEIIGVSGKQRFLQAVEVKLAPEWARWKQWQLIEEPDKKQTLLELAGILSAVITQNNPSVLSGVYATLPMATGSMQQGKNAAGKSTSKNCPCKRPKHPWKPEQCAYLEKAVTGHTSHMTNLTEDGILAIKAELDKPHWAWLKEKLAKKGWFTAAPSKGGLVNYPDHPHISTIIIPEILYEAEHSVVMYTARGTPLHPLAESTLLDNCGATHLVNSPDRLEPGSFVPSEGYVEAGTSKFRIIGKGTRVLHRVLNGPTGERDRSLTLTNVVVVEGFHTNIISEALLHERTGIWYSGFDCSLRWGPPEQSVVMAQLQRRYNLTFFQYKPPSSCSSEPDPVHENALPSNNEAIFTVVSSARRFRRFRPSREPPRPRLDSENLWHLRTGHLGKAATEQLIHKARNVRIKGVTRLECESCALTYAQQVVSRRPSEHRSPRPFWRVLWDLQDYERGYNGARWLLVIKDEYSGWLKAIPLQTKEGPAITNALFYLDRWVRRQFGLYICVFKCDNERAVIHQSENTDFQRSSREEGIVIETPPTNTHESNGGIEIAGKIVTGKSNVMLNSAGLPHELWPESTQAAVYLLNMSPSQKHDWSSPQEVLDQWFRTNAPLPIREHTADLSPDWSGIYAYGCRAYPLDKDREANKHRRGFKTSPRGHIGYLVGYKARNLYRIWVPRLEKVILTRNVRFNEHVFYKPMEESAIEQTNQELNEWIVVFNEDDSDEDEIAQLTPQEITSPALNSGVTALDPLQSSEPASMSAEKQPEPEHAPVQAPIGLQTPRQTPEPSAQLQQSQSDAQPSTPTAELQEVISQQQLRQPTPSQARGGRRQRGRARQTAEPTRRSARQSSRRAQGLETRSDPQTHTPSRNPFHSLLLTDHHEEDEEWYDHRSIQTTYGVFLAALKGESPAKSALKPSYTSLKQKGKQVVAPHRDELPPEPKTWTQVQNLAEPVRSLFIKAANLEVDTLRAKRTWREIQRSEAKSKVLPVKWVFTYKFDKAGYLERCKARLCVCGNFQEGATADNTYAATLAARSFRLMIALAARFDLEIEQLDIKNAFVNAVRGKDEDPVTCELPQGFKQNGMCIELDRALYGLRDSPKLWFDTFSKTLRHLGMESSKEEPCLFYTPARDTYLVFFVDDILVFYHRNNASSAHEIIQGIKATYELSEKGEAEWFLGIRIARDRTKHTIDICHDSYIEKIAAKFGATAQNTFPAIPIPVTEFKKRTDQATPQGIRIYQEKVGSVLYTAIMVRPDAAFAASTLSRFLTNPSDEHQKAADQAIRYLYITRHCSIRYGQSSEIGIMVIASDASFADDPDTRRSSQGHLISLFGGLITWKASRQATVTTSTTEAELLALEQTAKETMSLKRLFHELQFDPEIPWDIRCDNQQTIRLVIGESTRLATRLRHVDIHHMWLRQEVEKKSFTVTYLPTARMPADGLTKALPRQKFERFRAQLNMFNSHKAQK